MTNKIALVCTGVGLDRTTLKLIAELARVEVACAIDYVDAGFGYPLDSIKLLTDAVWLSCDELPGMDAFMVIAPAIGYGTVQQAMAPLAREKGSRKPKPVNGIRL